MTPRALTAAKVVLSLTLLAWCLSNVQLVQLVPLLADARVAVLLALIPLIALEAAAGAWRFKLILDTVHILPLSTHFAHYFVASYFNVLLPSSMGGDAVRVVMLKRTGADIAPATLMVFVDRVLGVLSLLTIALCAMFVAELPAPLERFVLVSFIAVAIAGLALAFGYRAIVSRTPSWAWLEKTLSNLRGVRIAPRALFLSAAMSFVFQVLTIAFTSVIAVGLRLDVSMTQVFALVPITWLATMIPLSIGGLGIREASFTVLFGLVGVSPTAALALSLGTYAVFVVMALIGALVAALADPARNPARRPNA